MIFISDAGISPYPQYTLNKGGCVYQSYSYDKKKGGHVFRVLHGHRFFLKLDFCDYPRESIEYDVDLYAEKDNQMQGVSKNAFKYDVDMIDIQIATKQHENFYILVCRSNVAIEEARFQFRLIVEGIE
jgi:hypothetical protein